MSTSAPATIRVRSLVWFATGAALMLAATLIVTSAWRADAAPGDTDTTFVPIAPCRLFDYRPGAGISERNTPLGPGETVVQQVTGAIGACNIPADATGIALNVTATAGTATSNLRIFPADVAVPNASNLNWIAGQGATPNKVDVKLSPIGAIGIYNDFGSVIPLADAVGYYTVSSLESLQGQIDALQASQPFALHVEGFLAVNVGATPTILRSLQVTAPVAGTVTLNASLWFVEGNPTFIGCEITTGSFVNGNGGDIQRWAHGAANADGVNAPLSITRGFEISAGATVTYNLVCAGLSGAEVTDTRNASFNAIFTPAAL